MSVTVYATEQRSAGKQAGLQVPVSPGAIGVRLVVDCDATATNTFTIWYSTGAGEPLKAMGQIETPATGADEVFMEYKAETHVAGTVANIQLEMAQPGVVGLVGTPIFEDSPI